MSFLDKRISESVLNDDLKPDVPTQNRMKRSWVELQKIRFLQSQHLRHSREHIAERTQHSIQSLTKNESGATKVTRGFSKSRIPGFRYRANGDVRQTVEESRKKTLLKSLTGLSKHVIEKKAPKQSRKVLTSQLPSTDSMYSTTPLQGELPETCTIKRHIPRKPFGIVDDDSILRVRKVQEQLGLSRPQSQGLLDGDSLQQLEHNFKSMHKALASAHISSVADTKVDHSKKGRLHNASSYITENNSDAAATSISSMTSARERCGACRLIAHSDVMDLVRTCNHIVPGKPRWRYTPTGRYVPPPFTALRITNPSLYRLAQQNQGQKINVESSVPTPKNPSLQAVGVLQLSGDECSSAPALAALRRKNSQENEVLDDRMHKFLNSLPESSQAVAPSAQT